MLTKTLSEAKKKQRSILIKAMNNDIGSIDSSKDSWNPAQISERAKDISYIRNLVDTWNPAQLNEALKMLDLPIIDTWNPAQIEEQRRNLVFYLDERTLTGNPITLKILGNLTPEVTGLKVTMSPIQDLNGYDYPWSGGAEKNKLNPDATILNSYINESGSIISNESNRTVILPCSPNTTYTYTWNREVISGSDNSRVASYTSDPSVGSVGTLLATITSAGGNATFTTGENDIYLAIKFANINNTVPEDTINDSQLELGSSSTSYAPYSNICPITGREEVNVTRTAGEDEETKTHTYSETIYGGVDDFVNGGLTNEWGYIASYDGETLPGVWISDRDAYAPDTTPSTGAEVAYRLETPTAIETTPEDITLLKGTNVLSTDGDSIELKYKQNF